MNVKRHVVFSRALAYFILSLALILVSCTNSTREDEADFINQEEKPTPASQSGSSLSAQEEEPTQSSTEEPDGDEEVVNSSEDSEDEETAQEVVAPSGSGTSNNNNAGTTELSSQQYISFDATTQTFSVQDANHTTPEDVLRELSYSGNYTGSPNFVSCEAQHRTLEILYSDSLSGPLIGLNVNEALPVEWQDLVYIHSCGWQSGEEIHIILKSPDQQVVYEDSKIATNNGGIVFEVGNDSLIFDYGFELNSQLGLYVLSFEGQNNIIEQVISAEIPGPRIYYEYGDATDQLILFNFQPNEFVRLFAYEESYEMDSQDHYEIDVVNGGFSGNIVELLVAWQELQLNSDGQLVLSVPKVSRQYAFRAIGAQSGQANINGFHEAEDLAIASPYDLSIRRPSQVDLQQIDSLWNLTDYHDLKEPGIQQYNLTVQSNEQWRWSFSWCAINRATLEEILRPLNIKFLVNGEEVSFPQVYLYDDIPSDGWACRRWATILSDWPSNETIELEIIYQLSNSIFDGSETFPAGEYRQVIEITADQ